MDTTPPQAAIIFREVSKTWPQRGGPVAALDRVSLEDRKSVV